MEERYCENIIANLLPKLHLKYESKSIPKIKMKLSSLIENSRFDFLINTYNFFLLSLLCYDL